MRYRPGPGFHRMLAKTEDLPGPGDRVVVGPVWPAVPAFTSRRDGYKRPAQDATLDGYEGPGLIEAVDGSLARVRLDDGRVVLGVKRNRLWKETAP